MVSRAAGDGQDLGFTEALKSSSDGYWGNLRADVDGDGMISSWDQMRTGQHRAAWFEVYKIAVSTGGAAADSGWPPEGNFSKFHPQRQKANCDLLSMTADGPDAPFITCGTWGAHTIAPDCGHLPHRAARCSHIITDAYICSYKLTHA